MSARIEATTPVWIVFDAPRPGSTVDEICIETRIAGLWLPPLRDLSAIGHPTLFTDPGEARSDARSRVAASVVRGDVEAEIRTAAGGSMRMVLYAADGRVLLDGEIR